MRIKLLFHFAATSVLLALSSSNVCVSQTAPAPMMARVTITHVKPDLLNEWLDLEKNEVVPALKKGGAKTRTVYATALFGNAGEYVIIAPIEKFAQFDNPSPLVEALTRTGANRLNDKLRKCVLSSSSYAITRLADLSNIIDGPPPPIIVSVRYRIAPGKMQDFETLVKSDVLPVYKKANVNLLVSRRGAGTNPNDVTMSTGLTKFADMDGGPFLTKQLGSEGAAKLAAKFTGIRSTMEVVVRRRVPELSF